MFCQALGLAPVGLWAGEVQAANADLARARLEHRLDLWRSFVARSQTMIATAQITVESSMLQKPWKGGGRLGVLAPNLVVLQCAGTAPIVTTFESQGAQVLSKKPPRILLSRHEVDAQPAAKWLNERVRAMFLPGDGTELAIQSTLQAPATSQARLDLELPSNHPAAALFRSVSMVLDSKSGAIVQLTIDYLGGDRYTAKFSQHQQGVAPEAVAALQS
jgi:hypothetical protein